MKRSERSNQLHKGSARFGVTKFSDLTPEEFSAMYKSPPVLDSYSSRRAQEKEPKPIPRNKDCKVNPVTFDWSECGAVTPIWNQGQCGAVWVVVAVELTESYYALLSGKLVSLSIQQVIDCDANSQGCDGGMIGDAFTYIEQYGLETAADYPYNDMQGTCKYNASEVVVQITEVYPIQGEKALYAQLSSDSGGPASVCIDADSWQDYQGGIVTQCSNATIDHCAELTGYANHGTPQAYWVLRNSWGTDWGEDGYIWIEMGHDECGIGDYANYVAVKEV
jgi:C1A family cysteine protease